MYVFPSLLPTPTDRPTRARYTLSSLEDAVKMVIKDGISCYSASVIFKIPRSTIQRRVTMVRKEQLRKERDDAGLSNSTGFVRRKRRNHQISEQLSTTELIDYKRVKERQYIDSSSCGVPSAGSLVREIRRATMLAPLTVPTISFNRDEERNEEEEDNDEEYYVEEEVDGRGNERQYYGNEDGDYVDVKQSNNQNEEEEYEVVTDNEDIHVGEECEVVAEEEVEDIPTSSSSLPNIKSEDDSLWNSRITLEQAHRDHDYGNSLFSHLTHSNNSKRMSTQSNGKTSQKKVFRIIRVIGPPGVAPHQVYDECPEWSNNEVVHNGIIEHKITVPLITHSVDTVISPDDLTRDDIDVD